MTYAWVASMTSYGVGMLFLRALLVLALALPLQGAGQRGPAADARAGAHHTGKPPQRVLPLALRYRQETLRQITLSQLPPPGPIQAATSAILPWTGWLVPATPSGPDLLHLLRRLQP